jgi:integrase
VLRITDEGIHPHKGQRSLKTSRSLSGRRTFPVPTELIRLGFIRYVAWLKESGEEALFPKLRPKGERGSLFPQFGEWWSKYLREHKVLPPGEGRKPAREFRHNWSTAARRSGLSEAAMEYIQGHSTAGKSANARYGSKSPLGLEIVKVAYPGLDLSGVGPWVPTG